MTGLMTFPQLDRARKLLCTLQDHIREVIAAARVRRGRSFSRMVAITAADTIYQVDRISEHAIADWFEREWPVAWPVEVVMEGLADGETLTFPRGTAVSDTRFKCILDPIDGTRGLMHDKRSAWVLGAIAPQRGRRTQMSDILVAAMTELPTSKQSRSDQLSAVRGRGLKVTAFDPIAGGRRRIFLQPSSAHEFQHGFASFVRFFPEGKALTAKLEEALWSELHPDSSGGSPLVFEDQYPCTGGQLYEIIAGHDRMIADLRPLVFRKLGLRSALVCHPYDICTAMLLVEAGGIVEAPDGRRLAAPLDTTTPVAWVGYANSVLARRVRPVLRRLIQSRLQPE